MIIDALLDFVGVGGESEREKERGCRDCEEKT